ncbi:hypothetical protein BGZ76_004277 [Entomortierella beljakovae]|nr:hypothetical protein BGZ76_004277 [Entomortierella beljakovae]
MHQRRQHSKMQSGMLLLLPALAAISSWSSVNAFSSGTFQTSSLLDLEMITQWEPSKLERFDPYTGSLLSPLLIPRVSGTDNNTIVQNFILDYFSKLNQTSLSGDIFPDDDNIGPIPPGKRFDKKKRQHYETADRLYRRAPGKKGSGWHVEIDNFQDTTPYGQKNFTNYIFTKNPNAENRLVFAAHFDSKYFPPHLDAKGKPLPGMNNGGDDTLPFIAATDSSVPCAIMLDLAASLDRALDQEGRTDIDTTLQLVFFDGEEAFGDWSHTDSLYGSRHLADVWQKKIVPRTRMATGRNGGSTSNYLEGIDLFVLLDLLGTPSPNVPSYFRNTLWAHKHTLSIEERLWNAKLHGTQNLLKRKAGAEAAVEEEDEMDDLGAEDPLQSFLSPNAPPWGTVDDDHRPFLEKGVPILHIIPTPFPSVWHNLGDNAEAVNAEIVQGWANIFRTFTVEYLQLLKPKDRAARDEL